MLNLHNVAKSFNQQTVLKNVSFSINKGDRIALLGNNGAGKSTLVKIISGELTMDSGDLHTEVNFKTEVGIMSQDNNLIDDLKVAEIVKLKSEMNQLKDFSLDEWLKKVSLEQQRDQFIDALSGGQKRRLSLILSMLNKPKLLLLDEPTTGMDIESVDNFWTIMDEYDFASLIITHDFNQIDNFFTRVLILKDGEIASDEFVENIHSNGLDIESHYRKIIKGKGEKNDKNYSNKTSI